MIVVRTVAALETDASALGQRAFPTLPSADFCAAVVPPRSQTGALPVNRVGYVAVGTKSVIEPIYETLSVLRKEWVMTGWSWDSRHSCVCSSFGADLERPALAAIQQAFPLGYNAATLDKADPEIQDLADRTGGLRADQLLFAKKPVSYTFAYGLWWPWGDELTISFRIGLAGHYASQELSTLQTEFRAE